MKLSQILKEPPNFEKGSNITLEASQPAHLILWTFNIDCWNCAEFVFCHWKHTRWLFPFCWMQMPSQSYKLESQCVLSYYKGFTDHRRRWTKPLPSQLIIRSFLVGSEISEPEDKKKKKSSSRFIKAVFLPRKIFCGGICERFTNHFLFPELFWIVADDFFFLMITEKGYVLGWSIVVKFCVYSVLKSPDSKNSILEWRLRSI